MSCTCAEGFTVQLHDGGTWYPVALVEQHTEISYYFDARCTRCRSKYGAPFARGSDSPRLLYLWLRAGGSRGRSCVIHFRYEPETVKGGLALGGQGRLRLL